MTTSGDPQCTHVPRDLTETPTGCDECSHGACCLSGVHTASCSGRRKALVGRGSSEGRQLSSLWPAAEQGTAGPPRGANVAARLPWEPQQDPARVEDGHGGCRGAEQVTAGGAGTSDLPPHAVSGGKVTVGGQQTWPGPLHRGRGYLDSLLMTLMRAPFSSFSRWLSDFSSVNTCRVREGRDVTA